VSYIRTYCHASICLRASNPLLLLLSSLSTCYLVFLRTCLSYGTPALLTYIPPYCHATIDFTCYPYFLRTAYNPLLLRTYYLALSALLTCLRTCPFYCTPPYPLPYMPYLLSCYYLLLCTLTAYVSLQSFTFFLTRTYYLAYCLTCLIYCTPAHTLSLYTYVLSCYYPFLHVSLTILYLLSTIFYLVCTSYLYFLHVFLFIPRPNYVRTYCLTVIRLYRYTLFAYNPLLVLTVFLSYVLTVLLSFLSFTCIY
jgi:hypothetical protein